MNHHNRFLAGITLILLIRNGQTFASPAAASAPGAGSIPFDQIGAVVRKYYTGDGVGIRQAAGKTLLRTDFQKLEGMATSQGLWLESTAGPEENEGAATGGPAASNQGSAEKGSSTRSPAFRVLATAVGRTGFEPGHFMSLPVSGEISSDPALTTFRRIGLTEEYRVSVDGLRQDFVLDNRPSGSGELSLCLTVSGARATAADYGARLTLQGSGREIAYSRLLVSDAGGRTLKARLEVPAPDTIRVVVDDAAAAYPVRIDPTFSDADWVAVNGGPNGTVRALAVRGTTIFVGGDFTKVGTVIAQRMARWVGTAWYAMGTGMDGPVYSLTVSGADLFAGGTFSNAGGVSASRIAKWDNTAWSGLGGGIAGVNAGVWSLASRGTDVFVGGTFTSAGSVAVQNIARWDKSASAWLALGAGVNGSVNALAVTQGILFAGGSFSSAGTVPAANLGRWNGNLWAALGTGVNGKVKALTFDGSDVYAGGDFSSAGGMPADRVAKWNDTSRIWSALGSGMEAFGGVNALAFTSAGLYAGGGHTAARWNGAAWASVGSGTDGTVQSILWDSAGHLFVGGSFTTAGAVASPYFAQLNMPTGPDISLFEDGKPAELLNAQKEIVDFGAIAPGASAVRDFRLRNDGVAALNVSALNLPAGFAQLGAGVPVTLAPGASGTFQVTFTGAAASGDYGGTMTLTSNDADEASFNIGITGKVQDSLSPLQAWRKQYFGITTSTADAADNADPDHDGIANLMEWACRLDPVVSGVLPVSLTRGTTGPEAPFEFTYTRSVAAKNAGAVYAVEWKADLSDTAESWNPAGVTESILSDDGTTQQVKALIPGAGQSRRFVHLRVTSPD